MEMARAPDPPCRTAIRTSLRAEEPRNGDEQTAGRTFEPARRQPGLLGRESAREGPGATVCRRPDEDPIAAWKRRVERLEAQDRGRARRYRRYSERVARVEGACDARHET